MIENWNDDAALEEFARLLARWSENIDAWVYDENLCRWVVKR